MQRYMIVLIAFATVTAAVTAQTRFTLGLLLGGVLALLNFRWLSTSLRGILAAGNSKAPPGTMIKFVFRWFVVAAVAYLAYLSGFFDPVGIVSGLLAPAAAVIIEAGYQGYRSLVTLGKE